LTEPEPEPVRVGHLTIGCGMLVIVYIRGTKIEIPVYPHDDGPLDAAGEVQPSTVVEMSISEACTLSAMLADAAARAADDGWDADDESVVGGLLDACLSTAAAIDAEFSGILPGRLEELSEQLAATAVAWREFLNSELAHWRPLRLVKDDDGDE
jgi:hypothetical protein